jgi:UDP-glucuronate 4-epimerase
MKLLITGSAGFIGFHLVNHLLNEGHQIVGIDNICDYYDVELKYCRLRQVGIFKEEISYNKPLQSAYYPAYTFYKLDLEDIVNLRAIFENEDINKVINLAGRPGVRYSIENPLAYIDSNIKAFANLLECCRYHGKIEHFVYASSSSVYGLSNKVSFSTSDPVDHPVSIYGVTKRSNELLAHSYSHLFQIPTTGIRIFTTYGPWCRPDMALFIFTQSILKGEKIKVFNGGRMFRDFIYIDDVARGISKILFSDPKGKADWSSSSPNPSSSGAPYKIYNLGNGVSLALLDFIKAIEQELGMSARIEFLPMQAGDIERTLADIDSLKQEIGFLPATSIQAGIGKFISWFKSHYEIK